MPFHWCADETFMLLTMLPFIGFFFKKIHAWWHTKSAHKCHDEHCDAAHVEHIEEPADEPTFSSFPMDEWDEVPVELIKEKFGEEVVLKLRMNPLRLGLIDVPSEKDFRWYVSSLGAAKAVLIFQREYVHDDFCPEGWDDVFHDE